MGEGWWEVGVSGRRGRCRLERISLTDGVGWTTEENGGMNDVYVKV